MTNGRPSNNLPNYFKFFASLAEPFEAGFMKPLWLRYPTCDSNSFDALALFLDGYAFARQGARPDFNHAAVDVVKELKSRGQVPTDESTAQLAWDMFKNYLRGEGLNKANDPLCPRGEPYTITYKRSGIVKPNTTKNPSIFEFLQGNDKYRLKTIVTLARESIKNDEVKDYHSELCGINGIGTKIASLFLRDVALFYRVFPSKDRYLLQPVDIWIRRISEHLLQDGLSKEETAKLPKEKIAKWIVEQAIQSDVNPEAVNGGMWYFGSQIAGSKYRMSKALDDLTYAKALLEEHMDAIRQEALVWEQGQVLKRGERSD